MIPNKLLVPVDGSENSIRASDFALELCVKLDASIVFLHVIEIPVSTYRYRRVAEDLFAMLEEDGNKLLSKQVVNANSKGVKSETVLSHGDPVAQILRICDSKKCDCIVLGKRGMGRVQRFLLGSVSDQVSKIAKVPVMIVK